LKRPFLSLLKLTIQKIQSPLLLLSMSITLSSTAAEKPEIRGIRSETLDNGLKIFVYEKP